MTFLVGMLLPCVPSRRNVVAVGLGHPYLPGLLVRSEAAFFTFPHNASPLATSMSEEIQDVEMKDASTEEESTKSENVMLKSPASKHSEKEKMMVAFRDVVWPALSNLGWTQVRRHVA